MGGASVLLERNTLRDGAGAGLLVEAGGDSGGVGGGGVARRNAIHGHAGANVQLSGAGGSLLLESNDIHSGGGVGVLVRGGSAVLRANQLHTHALAHVRLVEVGAGCALEGNTIRGGGDCGVALVRCGALLLARNTIARTAKAGVLAHGTAAATATTTATGAAAGAASAGAAAAPLLLGNTVQHSQHAGVYLYDGCTATLLGNEVGASTCYLPPTPWSLVRTPHPSLITPYY